MQISFLLVAVFLRGVAVSTVVACLVMLCVSVLLRCVFQAKRTFSLVHCHVMDKMIKALRRSSSSSRVMFIIYVSAVASITDTEFYLYRHIWFGCFEAASEAKHAVKRG